MFVGRGRKDKKWSGHTLILPCVSVGNVGQLTADLLISSLEMTHEGYLYDDSILPMVGADAIGSGDGQFKLTTACEVFENKTHKLVLVQQRAPIVKGKRSQFVKQLFKWIKSTQFSSVIILTSVFAHERIDSQLMGIQMRHVSSPAFVRTHQSGQESAGWVALETRPAGMIDADTEGPYMPGAGSAKTYYKNCCEIGLPCTILLRFCAEGDNGIDALQLATHLNDLFKWVNLKETQKKLGPVGRQGWRVPSSWRLEFGSRFEQVLYQ